jgi:predicted dehydrogenase
MAIKVSIIGLGKMGQNHLRTLSLLKAADIQYIYDLDEQRLKALSAEYDVPFTLDFEQAIDGCDAVYIVTPTSTHYEYFKRCSKKVKNIFIEKPLAASYDEAMELKELADQNGNFIQCGFVERFNPAFLSLKKILQDQKIINADFTRTNKLSSRITDVDVILDLMIHDIDLALSLNGAVKNIHSYGALEGGHIAFCTAVLKHNNGAISRLLASRMTEKKIRSVEITTNSHFIEAELLKKTLIVHQQSEIIENQEKPYQINSVQQEIEVGFQEALLTENKVFLENCINTASKEIPDLNSSLEVLKVAQEIINCLE